MKKNEFNRIDYFVIGLYILIGVSIFTCYCLEVFPQEMINQSILLTGFVGALGLYGFYFKRLRVLKVVSVWGFISLIQIVIYLKYKQHTDFFSVIGSSYLEYLIMLPILVVTFCVLRYVYWMLYKEELIITSGGMRVGRIVENRRLRTADFIFSIIGMLIVIFGNDLMKYVC